MSIKQFFFTSYQKEMGKHIKRLRETKGLSQLDLASRCNLEKTTISRIENGRTNITLKTSITLSLGLEVELLELYNFKIDIKKPLIN